MVEISGVIASTNCSSKIGTEVWVDNNCIVNCEHVDSPVAFRTTIDDTPGDRKLRIVMKHKQPTDTVVDADGNITKDVCLSISELVINQVPIQKFATAHAVYSHDFNGSQAPSQHRFYGDMGCNGEVAIPFSTPIDLWMLDKL